MRFTSFACHFVLLCAPSTPAGSCYHLRSSCLLTRPCSGSPETAWPRAAPRRDGCRDPAVIGIRRPVGLLWATAAIILPRAGTPVRLAALSG